MSDETLRIIVADSMPMVSKGALPRSLESTAQVAVDCSLRVLQANVARALSGVATLLPPEGGFHPQYEIDEVCFSLQFDAGGSVSLVSVLQGSTAVHTGLQFKIVRKLSATSR